MVCSDRLRPSGKGQLADMEPARDFMLAALQLSVDEFGDLATDPSAFKHKIMGVR